MKDRKATSISPNPKIIIGYGSNQLFNSHIPVNQIGGKNNNKIAMLS